MRSVFYFLIVASASVFFSCAEKKADKIVNSADYESYLNRNNDESLTRCNEELDFWHKKLSEVPDGEVERTKIAGLLSARFMMNGEIEDIEASDSLYHLILQTKLPYASIHRALAANAITQHKFREAKKEINEALKIGEGKAASLYMLVDVDLELGDYNGAKTAMQQFTNKNFFPYQIREAKLMDHDGKLDSAIFLMETALAQVKESPSLWLWTQSNLADMYGHAGRIQESYDSYLKVLKQNPDYDYALKGIALIAFSNDRNYAEARRIINYLLPKRATPDMHLLLAQIASAEKNISEKNKQLELFTTSARDVKYGDMYNKYLALLEAEEFSNPNETINIANREIRNRPTAQSFDLLAWGYFQKGDYVKALEIARDRIENRTYEPETLYHLGMIYKANGLKEEAKKCFEEISGSYFELGPAKAEKIKLQLEG
ncbi:hypothetical protein BH09BAC3_BH09BAC3_21530 [soil metagenome]